jgi:hypothetical protein
VNPTPLTLPRICVEATPAELAEEAPGVVDLFAALERQFFWADRVMLATDAADVVLTGEIVAQA